jgi:hypothetical protein
LIRVVSTTAQQFMPIASAGAAPICGRQFFGQGVVALQALVVAQWRSGRKGGSEAVAQAERASQEGMVTDMRWHDAADCLMNMRLALTILSSLLQWPWSDNIVQYSNPSYR